MFKAQGDSCSIEFQILDGIKEYCDIGCNRDNVNTVITNFKDVNEEEVAAWMETLLLRLAVMKTW